MLRITIRTNEGAVNDFANITDSLREVFDKNNTDLNNANVMINGMTVTSSELRNTFADFGVSDDSDVILSAIVKMNAAFEVKVDEQNGNILTIVTDIEKEDVVSGQTLRYVDKDNGVTYMTAFNEESSMMPTETSFLGNAFVGDKLAYVAKLGVNENINNVKKVLGSAVLAAKKYTSKIAEETKNKREAIDEVFDN